jgi:hypothetical protein
VAAFRDVVVWGCWNEASSVSELAAEFLVKIEVEVGASAAGAVNALLLGVLVSDTEMSLSSCETARVSRFLCRCLDTDLATATLGGGV